jgi:flagellar basal body-associated protein FliL
MPDRSPALRIILFVATALAILAVAGVAALAVWNWDYQSGQDRRTCEQRVELFEAAEQLAVNAATSSAERTAVFAAAYAEVEAAEPFIADLQSIDEGELTRINEIVAAAPQLCPGSPMGTVPDSLP